MTHHKAAPKPAPSKAAPQPANAGFAVPVHTRLASGLPVKKDRFDYKLLAAAALALLLLAVASATFTRLAIHSSLSRTRSF